MRAADRGERLLALLTWSRRALRRSRSRAWGALRRFVQGMRLALCPGSEAYLGGFGRPGPRTPLRLLQVQLAELGPFVLAAEPVLHAQPYPEDEPFVLVADRYLRSAREPRRGPREYKPSRRRRAEPLTPGNNVFTDSFIIKFIFRLSPKNEEL